MPPIMGAAAFVMAEFLGVAYAQVVIWPFANMSGDPEQDYFADGISEDLITARPKNAPRGPNQRM